MGTDLYLATPIRVVDTTAKIRLAMQYSEAGFHEDRSFALMLLVEAAKDGDAILERVSLSEALDPAWMQQHAAGFIRKVSLKIEGPRFAVLTITTTHPAWISHLPGRQWESRAFSNATSYKRCAAILPESESNAVVQTGENAGMMLVPTTLWTMAYEEPPSKMPTMLWVPQYGSAAYRVVNEVTGSQTRESLSAFGWRPVRARLSGFTRDGVLVLQGKHYQLWMFSAGAGGYQSGPYSEIEKIGALVFKPKALLGGKATYADVLNRMDPRIIAERRHGDTVELDLALGPDGRMPVVREPRDVERVTANRVRAHLMVSFELRPPKQLVAPLPNFDALDEAGLRAVFEAPPPIATLIVKTKKQGKQQADA